MASKRGTDESLPHVYLLRFSGELSTKARRTRGQFLDRMMGNLRDALASAGIEARVVRRYDRCRVEAGDASAEAVLARVFGLQSLSRVERRPAATLEDVVQAGRELFLEDVRGKRFAVRARRVGDRSRIRFRSKDIEIALGDVLRETAAGVDLDHPELTVHVEIYEGDAYFFRERVPAPGGLPLGSGGRAVALVSGGFDSAVAAWQISRRGVVLDHVFCNLGGASHQLGVLRVMKVLADRWSAGSHPILHAVDFEAVVENLRASTSFRYWQVLLKRLMLRAAQAVATETGGVAIVTGEALGQVSSQTLANLAVISEATPLPILRPLVGANKDEIIQLAHRIGTGELSAVVKEYCALTTSRPATAAGLRAILAEEERLDTSLLERAIAERALFDLRRVDPDAHGLPELELEKIPEGATVLDLRSRAAHRAWHPPGALYLDFAHALEAYKSFDRAGTYVMLCEFGLKSAHLAERMHAAGFRAYHVKAGARTLLQDPETRQALELAGPVPLSEGDPTG